MHRFLVSLAALLFCGATLPLLPACVDLDGDGIPDAPPGVGDDDDVAGSDDDDDDVEFVTLPLSVSTGSCGVSLSGEDLQVAVSHPEARGDEWQTPVPPRVTVPADGGWWRVEVYAVGYTMAETFIRLEGGNAYQSGIPEGEGAMVTSVAMAMHYNFSSLCASAQDYGNAQCSPSSGGERWHVDAPGWFTDDVSVSMGPYSPEGQGAVGLPMSASVDGCALTFTYDADNAFAVSVDPETSEFGDVDVDGITGHRL